MQVTKYYSEPIDNVREDLVGKTFKTVDIEENGIAIHLKREDGREYTIDTSRILRGVTVNSYQTEGERLAFLENLVDAIIQKLGIDEDALLDLMGDDETVGGVGSVM